MQNSSWSQALGSSPKAQQIKGYLKVIEMLLKIYLKSCEILKLHLHEILTFQCQNDQSHYWPKKGNAVIIRQAI